MYQLMLALALTNIPPAPVTLRYSEVYDEVKHRQHLPDCPPLETVMPHIVRIRERWGRDGEGIVARIRRVTSMPSFPAQPLTVYLVSCGRGISDPATVAVYADADGGGLKLQSDEDVLDDIVHELLHAIATSGDYDELWQRIQRFYRSEPALVRNHVLVAAFETRMAGMVKVRRMYAAHPEYLRALELAVSFGLTAEEPEP